jgi:hypothetical protein
MKSFREAQDAHGRAGAGPSSSMLLGGKVMGAVRYVAALPGPYFSSSHQGT